MPSTGERQLYLLAAALKFPKVENNKRFLFAVYFQNKAHYPTVKYFYTYVAAPLSDFNLFGAAICYITRRVQTASGSENIMPHKNADTESYKSKDPTFSHITQQQYRGFFSCFIDEYLQSWSHESLFTFCEIIEIWSWREGPERKSRLGVYILLSWDSVCLVTLTSFVCRKKNEFEGDSSNVKKYSDM